jgi:hypothetical protein
MTEKEMLDYKLKLHLMRFFNNTVVVICFTVLAIVFGKWWIVLFSALLMDSIRENKKG